MVKKCKLLHGGGILGAIQLFQSKIPRGIPQICHQAEQLDLLQIQPGKGRQYFVVYVVLFIHYGKNIPLLCKFLTQQEVLSFHLYTGTT